MQEPRDWAFGLVAFRAQPPHLSGCCPAPTCPKIASASHQRVCHGIGLQALQNAQGTRAAAESVAACVCRPSSIVHRPPSIVHRPSSAGFDGACIEDAGRMCARGGQWPVAKGRVAEGSSIQFAFAPPDRSTCDGGASRQYLHGTGLRRQAPRPSMKPCVLRTLARRRRIGAGCTIYTGKFRFLP